MSLTDFQRNKIRETIREFNTYLPEWELDCIVKSVSEILESPAENEDQERAYAKALEYEYVLVSFYRLDQKVKAFRFIRHVTSTPIQTGATGLIGLYDVRVVVDHFWELFRANGVLVRGGE
jgi:tRNA(Ile)-lysidine synthase TilS/MesJ